MNKQNTLPPPLKVAKFLHFSLVIDESEMAALMSALEPFSIFYVSAPCHKEELTLSKRGFLELWGGYIEQLKENRCPNMEIYRKAFSTAWSQSDASFFRLPLDEERTLLRPILPVIQLTPHFLAYSESERAFRAGLFGSQGQSRGVQFSYPQLYQKADGEICKVDTGPQFPDTALFSVLRLWLRHHTLPTPVMIDGKKQFLTMRLGKNCQAWIDRCFAL